MKQIQQEQLALVHGGLGEMKSPTYPRITVWPKPLGHLGCDLSLTYWASACLRIMDPFLSLFPQGGWVDGYLWTANWHSFKLEEFSSKDSKELWKLLGFFVKARYQLVVQKFERNAPSESEFWNADLNWQALLNLSGNLKNQLVFLTSRDGHLQYHVQEQHADFRPQFSCLSCLLLPP